jgi:hypothetical protein
MVILIEELKCQLVPGCIDDRFYRTALFFKSTLQGACGQV